LARAVSGAGDAGAGGIDSAASRGLRRAFPLKITLAIQLSSIGLHWSRWPGGPGRRAGSWSSTANFRARLSANEEEARAAMAAMWAVTVLALPSRDDEAALWGPEAPEALFRRLGVAEGVLKDGAAGPWSWDGVRAIHYPLPPAPRVVDSTAAGDGFNAGYLAACLQGEAPEAAVRSGHALALKILGQPGAIILRDRKA
jgi:2-dehydro-3-deoxygluconokinase